MLTAEGVALVRRAENDRKIYDSEDYTVDGDVFIAGNWYPSIDHVIPISKGGRHSWDNVKLAHRLCNSVKSNKT